MWLTGWLIFVFGIVCGLALAYVFMRRPKRLTRGASDA